MAKILLVEDDNNLREIYEARLQAEGYDIVAARDGEEALTVAMKERPDLIISDVMMPKISGFDMLDIIRSTEETKDAKVIMMTALSQAEDKERADKLGADRYLVKSQVTLEDVAKVAREVLSGETKTETATANAPAPTTPSNQTIGLPQPVSATPEFIPTPIPEPVSSTPTSQPQQPEPAATVQPDPVHASVPVAPAPTTTDDTTTATVSDSETTTTDTLTNTVQTDITTPVSAPVTDDTSTAIVAEDQSNPSEEQAPPKVVASDSPALTAVAPVTTPETSEEPAQQESVQPSTESASTNGTQTVADEKAAIASQIEEFIESRKTSEAPPAVDVKTKKKVITPINDPTASSGPNLDSLLEKEAEKDKMAQIAKQYAEKKILDDEEYDAEAALKEAADNIKKGADQEQSSQPASEPVTPESKIVDGELHVPEVKISEDGDLVLPVDDSVPPLPEPAPEPTTPEISTPNTAPASEPPLTVEEPKSPEQSDQAAPEEETPEQPSSSDKPDAASSSAEQSDSQNPEPVIPHKNGTSIDGVVPSASSTTSATTEPQPTEQDEETKDSTADVDLNDPNSIAL